ncbi:MAG: gluconeogenesis factor YvcK family protein [Candidatus Saccharimonadales bacterium]
MQKEVKFGGPKVVVIGGGTGSFTLLSHLKYYVQDITALVNMADDGGSTGQLRDEYGVLPPGDIRQCLVALSDNPKVRDLFNYRFEDNTLKGHAFGNLFLTALEKMTGSFADAVELAGEVLNITGQVEPITLTNVALCAEGSDGAPIKGEFTIAHAEIATRPKIWLEPHAEVNPAALKAIDEADIVVIAPGNLYGSLAPALVVPGVGEALMKTAAKRVYVCNLVTKPGPTAGFRVHDFADEIERLAGYEFLDYVLYNTEHPSDELMSKYAKDNEYAVECDHEALAGKHYEAKGANILANAVWTGAQASDPLLSVRSFIRHNSDAVARQLMRIYFA